MHIVVTVFVLFFIVCLFVCLLFVSCAYLLVRSYNSFYRTMMVRVVMMEMMMEMMMTHTSAFLANSEHCLSKFV